MTNKIMAANANLPMLEFFYKAIDRDLNFVYETNNDTGKIERRYLDNFRFGNPHLLFDIEKFVQEIASSEEVAFRILIDKSGGRAVRELKLAKHFKRLDSYLDQFSDGYDFSESVNLFFEACRQLRLGYGLLGHHYRRIFHGSNGEINVATIFNDLICQIRSGVRTKKFARKSQRRQRDAKDNYRKLEKYINGLFQHHKKLLVLRFDLSYRNPALPEAPSVYKNSNQSTVPNPSIIIKHTSLKDAKADLEKLLNYARSKPKLFGDRVGYIWKLEFCKVKGYHFHVIFFYNGLNRKADPFLVDEIGAYWMKRITQGWGYFHNCDVDANSYKKSGIGMIERDDKEKRHIFLRDGVGYLANTDQYLRVKLGPNLRAFGIGKLPPISRKLPKKQFGKVLKGMNATFDSGILAATDDF